MDTQKVISKMKKLLIPTSSNCTFSQLTTLGCGGTIELTIFPNSASKLAQAVRYLTKGKIPFCIVGRGSNILASDKHYFGVAVCTKNLCKLTAKGNQITAECGVSTPKIAKLCVTHGLSGGEFFACLPASIGGAICCNAGCFGQKTSDVVLRVKALKNGKIVQLNNKNCNFSHRNSIFKNNDDMVIVEATLTFSKGSAHQISHKIAQMKAQKAQTQPLNCRSAGCVLYHPTVAISKLIDEAGLKGVTVGGAKVSKKHAGFVVNIDKATSKDIYLLVRRIQNTLLATYNVTAYIELCLVNFDEDTNDIFSNHQNGNTQDVTSS